MLKRIYLNIAHEKLHQSVLLFYKDIFLVSSSSVTNSVNYTDGDNIEVTKNIKIQYDKDTKNIIVNNFVFNIEYENNILIGLDVDDEYNVECSFISNVTNDNTISSKYLKLIFKHDFTYYTIHALFVKKVFGSLFYILDKDISKELKCYASDSTNKYYDVVYLDNDIYFNVNEVLYVVKDQQNNDIIKEEYQYNDNDTILYDILEKKIEYNPVLHKINTNTKLIDYYYYYRDNINV